MLQGKYFPDRVCGAYATHLLQKRLAEIERIDRNDPKFSTGRTGEMRAIRRELQKRGGEQPETFPAKRLAHAA